MLAACLGCFTVACGEGWVDDFGTPENDARTERQLLDASDFADVPIWSDASIKQFFKYVRDLRWLQSDQNGSMFRRLPWLYPDGGCEERAAVVTHRAGINFLPRPYKIVTFGAVAMETDDHPSGVARWGFHIAPVVRAESTGEPWVLDAAVDHDKPLHYTDWLYELSHIAPVSAFVRDADYYSPLKPGGDLDYALENLESRLLGEEWDRQIELGRDPYEVLGDSPPWADDSEKIMAVSSGLMIPACVTCEGERLSDSCLAYCP